MYFFQGLHILSSYYGIHLISGIKDMVSVLSEIQTTVYTLHICKPELPANLTIIF